MRLSPLPSHRVEKIPIGIISADVCTDESGTIADIDKTTARILYCQSPQSALKFARKHGGTALILRSRSSTKWLKFDICGKTIFPGVMPDIEQLVTFRDYIHSIGITADSPQAIAFKLLRYTLPGYCDIADGFEIPFERFPPGARLYAKPGIYRYIRQYDITAAYLWGIGTLPTPKGYVTVYRSRLRDLTADDCSFAAVAYKVPRGLHHGPLPDLSSANTTFYPTVSEWSRPIVLSCFDIKLGLVMGVDFRIYRAWLPIGYAHPFDGFMLLIEQIRSKNFAPLAKQVGNPLWGSFGSSDRTAIVTFHPESNKYPVHPLPPRPAKSKPVSASVTARLRARLYEDIGTTTIQANTDGIMRPASAPLKIGNGGIGEWRLANEFIEIEILEPSWYRYIRPNGAERYIAAGRSGN